jgi:hypothetical protein
MADLKVKHSGVWKAPTKLYVKHSGTWKEPTGAWVKSGGTWQKFYPSGPPFPILGAAIDLDFVNKRYYFNGAERTTAEFGAYAPGGAVFSADGVAPDTTSFDVWVPGASMPGTFAAAYKVPGKPASNRAIVSFNDGSTNNMSVLYQNLGAPPGGSPYVNSFTAAVNQDVQYGMSSVYPSNQRWGVACSFGTNDFKAAHNGTPLNPDQTGTIPTGITRLQVGSVPGGALPAKATIARVLAWPVTKTQVELNDISRILRDDCIDLAPPAAGANLLSNGNFASPGGADPVGSSNGFSGATGWTTAWVSTGVYQTSRQSIATPLGQAKRLRIVATTQDNSFTALEYLRFDLTIDGPIISTLKWGTGTPADAKPVILRFGYKAEVAFVWHGISIRNADNTFVYASAFMPVDVGMDQYFEFRIPGCYEGTWQTATGQVGMKIHIVFGAGSSLRVPTGQMWFPGNYICTTNIAADAGSPTNRTHEIFDVGLYIDNGRGCAPTTWAG